MYDFLPAVKLAIATGKYKIVETAAGSQLGMVRDAATGQIVKHATSIVGLNPLTAAPNMIMGAAQLHQGHQTLQGIKALTTSVATLQSTMNLIGVGTAVTGALAAANLWQTLKLRKDVQQMRVEVREGFVDIKQILAVQGDELAKHIQQVSEDVEFRAHRTILARAYGLFEKAMNRLASAVTMQDLSLRSNEIDAVRNMLFQALSDYDNSQLMSDVGAAACIRRRECVWVIEQAIAMTYQMQGQWQTVSDRLTNLDTTIRQDAVATLDQAETIDELDFLFPELTRIHDHDLVAINAWNDHIDWFKTLSSEEMNQLNALKAEESDSIVTIEELDDDKPAEYSFYENAKANFVPDALYNSLAYSFDSELRQAGEDYIAKRASLESLSALNSQNLQKASPITVANLELYFAIRDEALAEEEDVAVAAAA